MLEWHFCIEGPANSPYQGGFYHGIIRFPQVRVPSALRRILRIRRVLQRNTRVGVPACATLVRRLTSQALGGIGVSFQAAINPDGHAVREIRAESAHLLEHV